MGRNSRAISARCGRGFQEALNGEAPAPADQVVEHQQTEAAHADAGPEEVAEEVRLETTTDSARPRGAPGRARRADDRLRAAWWRVPAWRSVRVPIRARDGGHFFPVGASSLPARPGSVRPRESPGLPGGPGYTPRRPKRSAAGTCSAVIRHDAESVRDHVEEVARAGLPQPCDVIRRRRTHASLRHGALARPHAPVTRRAEDLRSGPGHAPRGPW